MAELVLQAEKRDDFDKKETKRLRRAGRIPAVYYIHGEESVPVSIDGKEFRDVLGADSSIIDLSVGRKKLKCVVRDIQWHPVSSVPLHVDFLGVKLTEKLTVTIPVHLVGNPIGVKDSGGILQQELRELAIECLPLDIPEHVEVDVSNLDIGDGIHVSNITLEGVEILTDPEQSVAIIRPPSIIKEPTLEEEEEGITEPELIGEEEDEEKAEDEETTE